MIFAAGKGTRLKPLTNNTPKALVKVCGITLLERVLIKLKQFGITDVIINIHYLGRDILAFLKEKKNFGINISISDESSMLLDTGGGLAKASSFFDDTDDFVLYNVDILSDINLFDMWCKHMHDKNLATLAVRDRQTSRYFLFDNNTMLCGWENTLTGEKIIKRNSTEPLKPYAFSGIHIVSKKIFRYMPARGSFSITKTYLDLCSDMPIGGYVCNNSYWFDVGKHASLTEASQHFSK